MGVIHASFGEGSRPRQIYDMLRQARELTTAELQQRTGSMATSTDVAAARAQMRLRGLGTIRARYAGRSQAGRRVYAYTLDPGPGSAA